MTYEAEKLFGIDLNNDRVEGKNIQKINEHLELDKYGFKTYDQAENIINLYKDINDGVLYFASESNPTDLKKLLDERGKNFNKKFITPIAIEVIRESHMGENLNPLRADLFLNNNLVIALNEISREIVGYLFDQNGKLISVLGSTKNDAAIYDVENLFGFDLNKDNFKGDPNSNITKVDELQELKSLGLNTFENTYNSTNLYRDLVNGGIYVSSINDPSNKIELVDENEIILE